MRRPCKKVRKKLIAFLNHQLEEEKAKEVAQHLDTCPLCKKEAEELRKTWDLLGKLPIDQDFPNLLNGLLKRIEKEDEKISSFRHLIEMIMRIPAPALCLLIFFLGIPPGTLLGKNLYFTLIGPSPTHPSEVQSTYSEELPLDIFGDFPSQSLGNVYLNLVSESSKEE